MPPPADEGRGVDDNINEYGERLSREFPSPLRSSTSLSLKSMGVVAVVVTAAAVVSAGGAVATTVTAPGMGIVLVPTNDLRGLPSRRNPPSWWRRLSMMVLFSLGGAFSSLMIIVMTKEEEELAACGTSEAMTTETRR